MDLPKGGKGQKAPYESQMYRIAVPVKPTAKTVQDCYKSLLMSGQEALAEEMLAEIEALATRYYFHQESPSSKPDINNKAESKPDINNARQVLEKALTLKANAGGAIKSMIREALKLLEG